MGLVRDLLDVLLPTPCAACGELAGDGRLVRLCAACEALLPRQAWPLSSAIPGVASAWYLAPYQGMAGDLVRHGKYGLREELLAELAGIAARAALGRLPPADAVVSVPSPLGRRVARGFSPPGLLADALSAELEIPHLRALARRGGRRQVGLQDEERWRNVAGTVRLACELPGEPRLLLVDDVVTTGATAAACAEVLLVGGARSVHLYAFASALR